MKGNLEIMRIKDRNSFNEFCSEIYPALLSYARVFIPEDWSYDVVQDVFYSVWQKRDLLRDDNSGGVRAYMFRSVRNRCLDYIKSQERSDDFRKWNEAKIAKMAIASADYENNPVIRKLYDSDLRASLKEAIESLPPRCREVFCLSYIEDYSAKEIGNMLGISASTVENHVYAALKHLRRRLKLENLYSLAVFATILKKML